MQDKAVYAVLPFTEKDKIFSHVLSCRTGQDTRMTALFCPVLVSGFNMNR